MQLVDQVYSMLAGVRTYLYQIELSNNIEFSVGAVAWFTQLHLASMRPFSALGIGGRRSCKAACDKYCQTGL
jgi:hypothetical protein